MSSESIELAEGIRQLEMHFPDLIGVQAPVNSLRPAVKGAGIIKLETNEEDIFSADVYTRTGDFPYIGLRLYDYRNFDLPLDYPLAKTDWTVALMCGKGLYINYIGHEDQPAHNLYVNFVDTGSDIHLIPGGSLIPRQGDVRLYNIERTNGVLAFRYNGYPRRNIGEKHLIIPERIKPFLG